MADADELARTLREGDRIVIDARVRCVVDPGTGHLFVCAYVDDPPGRGYGWVHVRVPIETVKRAP